MTEEETVLGVPITTINQWRNLRGTWRHFARVKEQRCETRDEFQDLDVSDIEIAQYVLERQAIKKRDDALKAADDAIQSKKEKDFLQSREERERRGAEEHQEKYDEYLDDYKVDTEADKAALWVLAGIDLALRENQAAQYAYYGEVDPASVQNKKLLSDEVARLSKEMRQLQKMLGIDLPTRRKAEQEATGIDVVKDIVERSAEFIDDEITEIEHCGILVAWIADFFPETGYKYRKECPRCGETIQLEKEESVPQVQEWIEQDQPGRAT